MPMPIRTRPFIVCYHAVSSDWPGSSAVSEAVLAAQIASLRKRGYAGFTVSQAERLRKQRELPARSVVITFDDGYASVLRARQIVAAAGYPATVFVVTSFADSGEPLQWPGIDQWARTEHAAEMQPLSWDELESLQELGWEIGSHTVTHPRLLDLDVASLRRELVESRETISARLGECHAVAYPYGEADGRVAAAAEAAGYAVGCSLSISHSVDEQFRRPRAGIYDHDSALRFHLKISPVVRYLRRTRLAPILQNVLASPPAFPAHAEGGRR